MSSLAKFQLQFCGKRRVRGRYLWGKHKGIEAAVPKLAHPEFWNIDFVGFMGRGLVGDGESGCRTGKTIPYQMLRNSWYILNFGTFSTRDVINTALIGFHNIFLTKVSIIVVASFS